MKLGSNYPVPHLEWWKNGTRIRDPEKPTKENIARGFLVSQLVIDSVTEGGEGYYECIAVDGKKKGDKVGEGRHIISSPRAYVQVVCKFTVILIVACYFEWKCDSVFVTTEFRNWLKTEP